MHKLQRLQRLFLLLLLVATSTIYAQKSAIYTSDLKEYNRAVELYKDKQYQSAQIIFEKVKDKSYLYSYRLVLRRDRHLNVIGTGDKIARAKYISETDILKMDDAVEVRRHMEMVVEEAGLGGLIRAGK